MSTQIHPCTPAVSPRPLRACLLLRSSSHDPRLVAIQQDRGLTFIKRCGWTIEMPEDVRELTGPGRQGDAIDMALAEFLAFATSGRYDVVVVTDLPRLTRHTAELHAVDEALADAGVMLISTDGWAVGDPGPRPLGWHQWPVA